MRVHLIARYTISSYKTLVFIHSILLKFSLHVDCIVQFASNIYKLSHTVGSPTTL